MDIMPFGKYRGSRIAAIIDTDPAYILGLHNQGGDFRLFEKTKQRLIDGLKERKREALSGIKSQTKCKNIFRNKDLYTAIRQLTIIL